MFATFFNVPAHFEMVEWVRRGSKGIPTQYSPGNFSPSIEGFFFADIRAEILFKISRKTKSSKFRFRRKYASSVIVVCDLTKIVCILQQNIQNAEVLENDFKIETVWNPVAMVV